MTHTPDRQERNPLYIVSAIRLTDGPCVTIVCYLEPIITTQQMDIGR